MIHKCTIHTSSDVLSELLGRHNIRMAKSATKAAKIRRLLVLEDVTSACPPGEIEAVEKMLQELEEKRRKKASTPAEEDREEEDQASMDTISCLMICFFREI